MRHSCARCSSHRHQQRQATAVPQMRAVTFAVFKRQSRRHAGSVQQALPSAATATPMCLPTGFPHSIAITAGDHQFRDWAGNILHSFPQHVKE
jgi:hypothetical protein